MTSDWFADHYSRGLSDGVFYPVSGEAVLPYSDGAEVEERLLAWIEGLSDRSVLSLPLRGGIGDWPSRYHLSPRRANLLRPLQHLLAGQNVLEIGAGCGALTRFLGECGAHTIALEGSPMRARIAAARCRDLDGVRVVADTLQDFPRDSRFDVVTLIGVLEYARIFFPANELHDPVDEMLRSAVGLLRPGGVLIVAIENQLGLKYFAGYREDHVSEPMFGIEDRYEANGVVTFGRRELSQRLEGAGVSHQEWLYPYPDYKLPNTLLTQRGVSACGDVDLAPLLSASVLADPQFPPRYHFSMEQAWRPVYRNGLAGELANSFLVVASAEPRPLIDQASVAWHYAVERAPCFAKVTQFVVDAGCLQVRQDRLEGALPPRRSGLRQVLSATQFQRGRLWQMSLNEILNRPGWTVEQVGAWARVWLNCFMQRAGLPVLDLETRIPGEWADAVPRNLLVDEDEFHFIDLEWILESDLSFGHLCYRALVFSLMSVASVAQPRLEDNLRVIELFKALMNELEYPVYDAMLSDWHESESVFQCAATGAKSWTPFKAIDEYRLPFRLLEI